MSGDSPHVVCAQRPRFEVVFAQRPRLKLVFALRPRLRPRLKVEFALRPRLKLVVRRIISFGAVVGWVSMCRMHVVCIP